MCRARGVTQTPCAGEVLEHAVFLSIKLQDDAAFERNYMQLQTYYTDTRYKAITLLKATPWLALPPPRQTETGYSSGTC